MTPSARTSRAISVADLERAFGQDPKSSAYIPLCEAYLEQGRFMEAMVVAKKGLKAHPDTIESHALMARVYSRQRKYTRALQELDEFIAAHPNLGEAYLARARIRIESGDDPGTNEDLKKALDLVPGLTEATLLLAQRGIQYPVPAVPPVPPLVTPTRGAIPPPLPDERPASPGARLVSETGPQYPSRALLESAVREGAAGLPPGPRAAAIFHGYTPVRQRLEGEDELEELARKLAETKDEQKGSFRSSIMLVVVMLVALTGTVGYRVYNKRVDEGIAAALSTARPAFNDDTYPSYKRASQAYATVLRDFNPTHAHALSRLAHTDAILWGEHGDTDLRGELDAVLTRAQKNAANEPDTLAAIGLVTLYSGLPRQKAAAAAFAQIAPGVRTLRGANDPSNMADLTLAILQMELGDYESAVSVLQQLDQGLVSSVRAKVWHGRAAYRAGRLAEAESAFSGALRAVSDHPGARAGRALVRLQRGNVVGAAEDVLKFDEFEQNHPKDVSRRDRALVEYARSETIRQSAVTTEDASKAEGAYEAAVRLDPNNADFPYGLGRWLLRHGRAKDALVPLRKAVEMESNRRAFLIALGSAELEISDFEAAGRHIDAALKQDSKDLDTAIARARLLIAQHKDEAEVYLKEVLGWSKGALEANLELARYYRGVGKKEAARPVLEKAIESMERAPQTLQGAVLLEYAKLMLEFGDETTALNTFRKAAENGETEAWFRIAQLLIHSGARKEAKDPCLRYLGSGSSASLPYASQARQLCEGL